MSVRRAGSLPQKDGPRLVRILWSLLRALGFLWSMPVTLIGLAYAGFLGPQEGKIRNGCLWIRCSRLPYGFAATTQGHVISYVRLSPRIETHELRHVAQCDLFGPLILLLYPLCSLVSRLRGTGWYWGNALEADARKAAGQ